MSIVLKPHAPDLDGKTGGLMSTPPQEGFWRVFAAVNFLPISGTDKAVLGCLVDCANSKTGACWPKQETVARAIGRDLRVVKRSIKNLESTPYLKKTRRRWTSNRYELGWEAILAEFDAYKDRRSKKAEGSPDTRKFKSETAEKAGDKDVTSGVTETSPEEVSETSPYKENNYKKKKKRNSLKASPRGGDAVNSSPYPPAGDVGNVGGMLAQFERAFKRNPSGVPDLEGWLNWLEYEASYIECEFSDTDAQRAKRLAEDVSSYLEDAAELAD